MRLSPCKDSQRACRRPGLQTSGPGRTDPSPNPLCTNESCCQCQLPTSGPQRLVTCLLACTCCAITRHAQCASLRQGYRRDRHHPSHPRVDSDYPCERHHSCGGQSVEITHKVDALPRSLDVTSMITLCCPQLGGDWIFSNRVISPVDNTQR